MARHSWIGPKALAGGLKPELDDAAAAGRCKRRTRPRFLLAVAAAHSVPNMPELAKFMPDYAINRP